MEKSAHRLPSAATIMPPRPGRRHRVACRTTPLLALPLLALLAGCQPAVEKISGPTMGSTYQVSFVREGNAPDASALQAEVGKILGDIDKAVSTYRDDSDVARFNAAPAGTCMDMPEVALTLAERANAFAAQGKGAFDITLLPVLDAWGFGPKAARQKTASLPAGNPQDRQSAGTPAREPVPPTAQTAAARNPAGDERSGTPGGEAASNAPSSPGKQGITLDALEQTPAPPPVPSEATLAALRTRIGQQHLRIEGKALCKDAPIQIEFNSIAAGAAVDRIAERFEQLGIRRYLIEVTGEIRGKGKKPDGSPWRVAIEAPIDHARQAQRIIALDGHAISTSGDYRHYREEKGKRYSHMIDPRTLHPVTHKLAAVTVSHPQALDADGLSTLLMALGPDAGQEFARANDIAALFVSREGSEFVSRTSPAFDRLYPPPDATRQP